MTFTSYERREVAARLRGVTEEELCYVFLEEILNCAVGGRCLDDEGNIDERLILNRLADLIDRPTCERVECNQHYWLCSRCGVFVYWDAITNLTGVVPTRYCPNCGAFIRGNNE